MVLQWKSNNSFDMKSATVFFEYDPLFILLQIFKAQNSSMIQTSNAPPFSNEFIEKCTVNIQVQLVRSTTKYLDARKMINR